MYKLIALVPAKLKPELHSNGSFTLENIKDCEMIFSGDSFNEPCRSSVGACLRTVVFAGAKASFMELTQTALQEEDL